MEFIILIVLFVTYSEFVFLIYFCPICFDQFVVFVIKLNVWRNTLVAQRVKDLALSLQRLGLLLWHGFGGGGGWGCCGGVGLVPGLGISTCLGCGQKEKKKAKCVWKEVSEQYPKEKSDWEAPPFGHILNSIYHNILCMLAFSPFLFSFLCKLHESASLSYLFLSLPRVQHTIGGLQMSVEC